MSAVRRRGRVGTRVPAGERIEATPTPVSRGRRSAGSRRGSLSPPRMGWRLGSSARPARQSSRTHAARVRGSSGACALPRDRRRQTPDVPRRLSLGAGRGGPARPRTRCTRARMLRRPRGRGDGPWTRLPVARRASRLFTDEQRLPSPHRRLVRRPGTAPRHFAGGRWSRSPSGASPAGGLEPRAHPRTRRRPSRWSMVDGRTCSPVNIARPAGLRRRPSPPWGAGRGRRAGRPAPRAVDSCPPGACPPPRSAARARAFTDERLGVRRGKSPAARGRRGTAGAHRRVPPPRREAALPPGEAFPGSARSACSCRSRLAAIRPAR